MVQLLTWEWLARDIMFQLSNDRSIGLPWRRSSRQTTGMEGSFLPVDKTVFTLMAEN